MTTILPRTGRDWLRFAFWALESIVVMLTVRDAAVRLPSMQGESFADSFYWLYRGAALALVILAFRIRRFHPALAKIGWITAGAALLWSGIVMPID